MAGKQTRFLGLATGGLGLGLLGQKHSLDVGQHTALGNGHPGEQLVQFLIIPGEEKF